MTQPAGYDAKKAETFNKLRQQGLTEDQAAAQAGINNADFANYTLGDNGQLGPNNGAGLSKVAGKDYDLPTPAEQAESDRFNRGLQSPNFEQVEYAQTSKSSPDLPKPINYTTTSTETVSGGGTQSIVAGPRIPNAESKAIGTAYQAKQDEYNQFIKDNPSDFQRKKQGLPPMSPEEKAAYQEKLDTLNKEKSDLKNKQIDAETAGPPTETNTPNTTTTNTTVTTGKSATNEPVNEQNDQQLFNQTETQINSSIPTPPTDQPQNLNATEDPFEASRVEAAAGLDNEPRALTAEDIDPMSDEEIAQLEERQAQNREVLATTATDLEPGEDPFEAARLQAAAEENPTALTPADVDPMSDEEIAQLEERQAQNRETLAAQENYPEASQTAVGAKQAQQQSTLQARVAQAAAADWRVRLRLAPNATYLYKDKSPGILKPLAATDGVIFPYTPSIETSYQAKYDSYDLTHSNYRGYFYKNSSVENISIKGTFTAQDSREAAYLLAVIHFFRSVTKMFYGQDQQAGTPPPLVYLSGFGKYQFNEHPCVVSNFGYSLPTDVDYIRADGFNNIGLNLENRRTQTSGPAIGGTLGTVVAIIDRLTNAGLGNGSLTDRPNPSQVNQNVTNQTSINSTYVPTKMDIALTLLPMQTRNQVSKQFSLQGFAQGRLLEGGFW